MINSRLCVVAGMILLAALSRLLPHPPNVAPIMAIALFGGTTLSDKRFAYLIPIAGMFLSDLFLGLHRLIPIIYVCFLITVVIGQRLRECRSTARIASAAFASSVLFFLGSNFGVWAMTNLYPKTAAGLLACYVAAIPFFQNSLIGDAFYTVVLFGGFALAERIFPALQKERFA